MNLIDFTKNGGYRLKQFTLRKMQESTFEFLKAFIAFCNVPDTGNYIIAGMQVEGNNITAGFAYIDGELCRFEQTLGAADTGIKKRVVVQSLGFRNGNNENVFRFVSAVKDNTGTPLNQFTRVSPVFDPNYVSTENNFSDAWIEFLLSIEYGAEKNVQPDWDQANDTLDDFIKNKPFKKIQHVYGQMTVSSFFETNNPVVQLENNTDYNYGYIFPPAGFEITDLAGFIPSINKVYFRNTVNGDDTLYCNYQIDAANERVIVICSNSESRLPASFNYLAIWIKQ